MKPLFELPDKIIYLISDAIPPEIDSDGCRIYTEQHTEIGNKIFDLVQECERVAFKRGIETMRVEGMIALKGLEPPVDD